jgi:hypothetical protein
MRRSLFVAAVAALVFFVGS